MQLSIIFKLEVFQMHEVRTSATETGEKTLLVPANVLPITLFCSTQIWNPQNCIYPVEVKVDGPDQLRTAVCFDHVFVKFKGNRRSNKNFEYADLLVLDCDNDHSDDSKDWIWPDDLSDLMPGVAYAAYSSRSSNMQKGDRSPRPRFHAIFPIDRVTSAEEYAALKQKTAQLFPFFDHNALDAGRFFFGTFTEDVIFQSGELNLTQFLACQEEEVSSPEEKKIIREGQRNTTLSREGAKIIKRWGDTSEARQKFLELAACCDPPLPEKELGQIWHSVQKFYVKISAMPEYIPPEKYNLPAEEEEKTEEEKDEWEEPIPLIDETLPEFPVDALPAPIRDFVLALSESMQTAPDMPAACALGALSVCLQGKYSVRINADWLEQANLYTLVIADPSEKKSPCLKQMTSPILRFEETWNKEHADEISQSHQMKRVLEKKADNAENACVNGKLSREEMEVASRKAREFQTINMLRLFLDDVTPEALTSHLAEHNGVAAIMSAEGGVFDNFAGRYNGKNNLDTALKAYSGDPIRVDRKGRPSETIPHPSMTILMMIQPAVLSTIMENKMFKGQGLTARFLYCLPESRVGYRDVNPLTVPPEIRKGYEDLILRLLQESISKKAEEIAVSAEAEMIRRQFADDVEHRLLGDLEEFREWAGKIVGTAMRIAAILCLAETQPDEHITDKENADLTHYEISAVQMIKAVQIANYYIDHAKAAFRKMGVQLLNDRCDRAIQIIKKQHLTPLTLRDLMRACRFLRNKEKAQEVLDQLEIYGYLSMRNPENRNKVGRPGDTLYDVNPWVFERM